jgi:hypothetical protein
LTHDHFKFKHFIVDGGRGFAYIRSSDQEIVYGLVKNTISPLAILEFATSATLVPTLPGNAHEGKAAHRRRGLSAVGGRAARYDCVSGGPNLTQSRLRVHLGPCAEDLIYSIDS